MLRLNALLAAAQHGLGLEALEVRNLLLRGLRTTNFLFLRTTFTGGHLLLSPLTMTWVEPRLMLLSEYSMWQLDVSNERGSRGEYQIAARSIESRPAQGSPAFYAPCSPQECNHSSALLAKFCWKLRASDIGPFQVHHEQVSAGDIGIAQISAAQIGSTQVCAKQTCVGEIGF